MQSELKELERLVPLRRFAEEDLYSPSYLSLLVQRKKLRAKKIGRNFYTTQRWFEEYLRKHAKDEIREAYTILLRPIVEKPQPKADPLWAEKIKNSNSKIIQINFNWKAAALAAVFFVASITTSRSRRKYSTSGCDCLGRFPRLCCGCSNGISWLRRT